MLGRAGIQTIHAMFFLLLLRAARYRYNVRHHPKTLQDYFPETLSSSLPRENLMMALGFLFVRRNTIHIQYTTDVRPLSHSHLRLSFLSLPRNTHSSL